jgi:hypothetical protein
MIESNLPIYIYDTELLSKDEAHEILMQTRDADFHFETHSIGAATDGYTGIPGDRFLDRPIMVAGSNNIHEADMMRPIAKSIFLKFAEKHSLVLNEVFRTRTNISFTSLDTRPTVPHVDLRNENKHFVFIYYLNDSDGDTILFTQKVDGHFHTEEDLEELKRFSPVGGGALLFNGDYFHTWEHPSKHDYRATINLNVDISC